MQCGVPVNDGFNARDWYIQRCANGDIPQDVPAAVAGALARHAAVAVRMNEFCLRLYGGGIHAEYPGS
jgi:hypothetical protein